MQTTAQTLILQLIQTKFPNNQEYNQIERSEFFYPLDIENSNLYLTFLHCALFALATNL